MIESSEDEVDADFDAPELPSDEDEVIVGKDGEETKKSKYRDPAAVAGRKETKTGTQKSVCGKAKTCGDNRYRRTDQTGSNERFIGCAGGSITLIVHTEQWCSGYGGFR